MQFSDLGGAKHHVRQVSSRFRRCESGGVAILFGLFAIPLLFCAGLAIDYTRALSVQHHLQFAADAAALAARGAGDDAQTNAEATAEAFAKSNAHELNGAKLKKVVVTEIEGGVRVELAALVPTSISKAVGVDDIDVSAVAEAMRASAEIEIALVLDNTGSMAGSMDQLKTGAKDLVSAIYGTSSSSSKVKFAVVPYVGAVNIGNTNNHMAWMDASADASWHGQGIEGYSFGYEPGCVYTPSGGGSSDPGVGTQGWLGEGLTRFASAMGAYLGISSAHAATAADVPSPYQFWPNCWLANPAKMNMFDTFAKIPNTSWKGCVMARSDENDLDVSDAPPTAGDPETLFVPWFWPDTLDQSAINANDPGRDTPNDYLPDRLDLRNSQFPKFTEPWIGWGHWNWLKYNGTSATIDETGPDTLGPNKACPDPILPLSNDKSAVINKIDSLTHWNGSGTNTAEGIAWGMRVLTPGEPFTEGSGDEKTQKVMVVMTDGVNNVDPTNDGSLLSHWSAYGSLNHGRIQPMTYDGFRTYVNGRMQKACELAKQENIQIYTVAFNVTDQATLDLLEGCATKPPYAYSASTTTELVDAFRSIGTSLTELRLTK